MADGKWIEGLSPEMPVAEAARLVLSARFALVRDNLAPAVESPYSNSEFVHQLRVGTRRCRAALEAFQACLPKKDVKQTRQLLRTLRRAAGDARDWDVFLQSLHESRVLQSQAAQPTLDFLTGFTLGQRSAAQVRLVEAARKAGPEFLEISTALPERLHQPRGPGSPESFGQMAENDLGTWFDDFVDAVEANPSEPDQLHRLRILGKHFRYSIEIHEVNFDESLRLNLYPAVESVQELLGGLQDARVALDRLELLKGMARKIAPTQWQRLQPGITKLAANLRTRLRTGQKKFQSWRTGWLQLVEQHPLAGRPQPAEERRSD